MERLTTTENGAYTHLCLPLVPLEPGTCGVAAKLCGTEHIARRHPYNRKLDLELGSSHRAPPLGRVQEILESRDASRQIQLRQNFYTYGNNYQPISLIRGQAGKIF
jgi:hypothetical protein